MKKLIRNLATLVMIISVVGCSRDRPNDSSVPTGNATDPSVAPPVVEKAIRTYRSESCFLNRLETETSRGDYRRKIYTIAEFTFDRAGIGFAKFKHFSDSGCLAPIAGLSSATFEKVTTITVDQTIVFVLERNTLRNRRWYIPAVKTATGYRFAVNHEFENAGPYVVEPVAAELGDFQAEPEMIGIAFTEIL